MFGKLTLLAIPYHVPIIMGAVLVSLLGALVVIGLITYYHQWGYLWRGGVTSLYHKKKSQKYYFLHFFLLFCGGGDRSMMLKPKTQGFGLV